MTRGDYAHAKKMTAATTTDMGRRVALAAITDPSLAPNPGPLTAMLVDDTHVFGAQYSYASDVPDEISATGYARTVVAVAGLTTHPDGRVTAEFSATAFGIVGNGLNARISGCYLFADSGTPATSPVLHAIQFASIQLTDGTQLRITWSPISAAFLPVT